MRAKNTNKMRQFSSLLNEHWKRKQRLKCCCCQMRSETSRSMSRWRQVGELKTKTTATMIDILRPPLSQRQSTTETTTPIKKEEKKKSSNLNAPTAFRREAGNCHRCGGETVHTPQLNRRTLITFTTTASLFLLLCLGVAITATSGQTIIQSDPRPTIYSGQVSFGLLLSAHSSLGAELSTSASHQVNSMLSLDDDHYLPAASSAHSTTTKTTTNSANFTTSPMSANQTLVLTTTTTNSLDPQLLASESTVLVDVDTLEFEESGPHGQSVLAVNRRGGHHAHDKRQIFERAGHHHRRQQQQPTISVSSNNKPSSHLASFDSGLCNQVNPNALYAGMGAIWASHQANLVGDSHLAIGTYVYDSCNDLDVGQRQSVRIVSNLNAFQQTTCESPRGSPISLTIAHGDNQLRAIQLLTSFRVPVITTRENFALEDYNQLSRDQKRFLFTTAPSSRHLAVGALRFSKRIVSRSTSSPKLPNQFYKMSSKNGLIVISRNLPARFIAYLTEMIPNHVNYEMLQSNQPIDQIRSVEVLESILIKGQSSSSVSSTSESKVSKIVVPSPVPVLREKRTPSPNDDSDSSSNDGLTSEYDSSGEGENSKQMLSPTILMFITPSEAIDLITRLRNDLAEVSKYYSLIVTTREDISPALKTIFHRGGSRLCSGKAFYTISPKPDDISEFSRYFRDTVQMEGETSDHPLVCEFAKYQSTSKVSADLDDISTEPVIKAVWTAAAAFKSVHRRECASLANSSPASNVYRAAAAAAGAGSSSSDSPDSPATSNEGRSSRQSSKSAHAECMVKMNKNMSNLVQRALKRLDVTINSTGLQSLDGFRLKFDDMNELMTNKFSIKYINKECEITEIGQYSGFKDSSLRIDEETLVKSLESTMPDPWPVAPAPTTPETATPSAASSSAAVEPSSGSGEASNSAKDSAASADSADSSSGDSGEAPPSPSATANRGRRKLKSSREVLADEAARQGDDDDSSGGDNSGDSGESNQNDSPKRTSKRSRTSEGGNAVRQGAVDKRSEFKKKHLSAAAPLTAMSGRGFVPGVTDTVVGSELGSDRTPSASRGTQTITTTQPTTTDIISSGRPMRRLKPFPSSTGTTLKDWLPIGMVTPIGTQASVDSTTRTPSLISPVSFVNKQHQDNEQVDSAGGSLADLKMRGTTQAPVYSTLPESGGNADLELPSKQSASRVSNKSTTSVPNNNNNNSSKGKPSLDTAATTTIENTEYVTSPSISKKFFFSHPTPVYSVTPQPLGRQLDRQALSMEQQMQIINNQIGSSVGPSAELIDSAARSNYFKDLNTSPIPLSSTTRSAQGPENLRLASDAAASSSSLSTLNDNSKNNRSRLRSHLNWIYSSWFALSILGANICGALMTLYVLTFLLMKNCDGSLDRENQGIRSMHLLAIIVVFFGSTLFIVYPTPGLCLLRTSWHNFALVMLFGSLLLQSMQTRSLSSLGLGGRPNRLNQFLTLIFMVGVQVAFELQRWKYESANYLNFVNQYFGSSEGDKKLMILSSTIANQFNPLNSFNDQVTPVSIQVSEQYQNLLQDYCLQQEDDFLQSQIYICIIVGLLFIFSATTRKSRRIAGSAATSTHHKLTSALTSGKLVASEHEVNLNLTPSHFQFASNVTTSSKVDTGNVFMVTLISAPIYSISIVLHIYGQNTASRDMIFSVTLVLIAFVALIGIFLPILLQIHRYDGLTTDRLPGTLSRPVITQSKMQENPPSSSSNAFAMFPEFAPTGLRRPSSASGDSSSGAGSRRPFAETKVSRRNMGAALANLGPSEDSLRSMGFYDSDRNNTNKPIDPALLNLKLNLSANEQLLPIVDDMFGHNGHQQQQHQHSQQPTARRVTKGEKGLIRLDIDPCCPRHGIGAWQRTDGGGEPSSSKSCKSRTSHHSHQ